jgi:RNA polymerase sigma-70 factor (ECF subfamily)
MKPERLPSPKPDMDAHAVALGTPPGDLAWSGADEALVLQAMAGDVSAFETLFERHRMMVYRFISQMAGSRDDTEDITQECFVRAFEKLDNFRAECRFTTWLMRIAVNLCTDRARMKVRRTALEDKEAADGLIWMTGEATEDPVENMELERRANTVRRALNALPEHHKLMIVLRDFEEREYDEISAIIGCTYGGAKLRVLRARRALRDRLRPLLEGEGDYVM